MISDSKILHYVDRIEGERKPITADVFLNNFCNNNCPYCTYRRWGFEKGATSMSFENFERYAKILLEMGIKGIILTGGGEPTISKDFDKIVTWLEENNISYGINTNFNVLKYISPVYLKISLDGYDEASYYKNRGVKMYHKVVENIKKYAEWKNENKVSTKLGIQKVVTNLEELERYYEANKTLPVDYIVLRPIESTLGDFYKSKNNLSQAKKIIARIKELQQHDGKICLNYKWGKINAPQTKCPGAWSQIALNELGEVMYCCHKPFEIVGHITDQDVWQKKQQFRTDFCKCDIPCRLSGVNETLLNYFDKMCSDIGFI